MSEARLLLLLRRTISIRVLVFSLSLLLPPPSTFSASLGPSYTSCFSPPALLVFVFTRVRSIYVCIYIYLALSHVQLAFTSVFPSHSRGSRRSDLSAVLTTDRDRQACNYIVIYACYGAQPAWPVGLQRTPPFPASRRRVALSLSRGCGFKCRAAFRRRLILRPCRQSCG